MRLIDANAAAELLHSLGSRDYRREKGTIMDAVKMLSNPKYTPTVDAVPVVRCKDCVYNENGTCTHSECFDDTKYRPDYFCADGERRSDDA